MTTADEKMREEFEVWWDKFDHAITSENASGLVFHSMFTDGLSAQEVGEYSWQASAAKYSERIKELEQQNEQLQAQMSSSCEFYQSIIDANYRDWDCGLNNAEEFVRWIKSRAVHALSLSATKTAEAYKRRVQAEASPLRALIEKHSTFLEANPYCYFELAYTRRTEWMAWICSKPQEDDPQRVVLARGQGSTPDEAAQDAIASMAAELKEGE